MAENLTVTTERVDDIPVLFGQAKRMGLPESIDEHFAPHGNWQGTSMGTTACVWLTHILSEGDHRLNQVENWVAQRLETIGIATGQSVRSLEWSDDRLGIVLDTLSDDKRWAEFEADLDQRLVRVYSLQPEVVRLDSTTASGHWAVTDTGLFQVGHSKDHRPDLPQLKVMVAALDPMGMPLAVQVISGERADDPLYVPAIRQVSEGLQLHGLLYVGDCKMAALDTRGFVQSQGDYYLCPLSKNQMPDEELEKLLTPVWDKEQSVVAIYRNNKEGQPEQIAEGYEVTVSLTWPVDGRSMVWDERRLVIRSLKHAQATEAALRTRLDKTLTELAALNERKKGKKRFTDEAEVQQAVGAVLRQRRVTGLVQVELEEQAQERSVRAYRNRPAEVRVERDWYVKAEVDEQAVSDTGRWFGWRAYATNATAEALPLDKAVLAYREEYVIEHGFGRLKGKPLSLTPMYLQSDERATGLIRLLSLGLRLLTLVEFMVRRELAKQGEMLAGLYAGNPKRSTSRPTAEALLQAFDNITLSVINLGEQVHRHVTPLSTLQTKILTLLGFSSTIYDRLCAQAPNTS
jgi:transposase